MFISRGSDLYYLDPAYSLTLLSSPSHYCYPSTLSLWSLGTSQLCVNIDLFFACKHNINEPQKKSLQLLAFIGCTVLAPVSSITGWTFDILTVYFWSSQSTWPCTCACLFRLTNACPFGYSISKRSKQCNIFKKLKANFISWLFQQIFLIN